MTSSSKLFAGLLATAFILVPAMGAGCKKKAPKLTANECDRFCKRMVPCFKPLLANFAERKEKDIKQCIHDCTNPDSENHADILRAMKKCGDIDDCKRLKDCFGKAL